MSFERVVSVTLQTVGSQAIEIVGLRISFTMKKTEQTTPNQAEIVLYNVSKATFDKTSATDANVIVKAGYEDEGGAKIIFIGNLTNAKFYKEGTETRMEITCFDGQKDYRALPVTLSFKAGTTISTIVDDILSKIPLTVAKKPISISGSYSAGYAYVGRALDALREVLSRAELSYSIQNEELYILEAGQTIEATAFLISPKTGLLESPQSISSTSGIDGSPVKEKRYKVRTLLNPKLLPKSYIQLDSKVVSGFFKIQTIQHKGDNIEGPFESVMEVIAI